MKFMLVGIDPGLVDTGVVMILLDTEQEQINTAWQVFNGSKDTEPVNISSYITAVKQAGQPNHVYISVEAYNPRSNYSSDKQMLALVRDIAVTVGGVIVNNTGSKAVIRPAVLARLGVKKFPATHHQDLQAAARIMVWGALKEDELNRIIARAVYQNWRVV